MKFVKLSVLALSLGLFVASCGGNNAETPKTDSVAAPVQAEATTPAQPTTTDTTTAPPAKTDSAATTAPAGH